MQQSDICGSSVYPPYLARSILTLPVVSELQRLIEESIPVDMDRTHVHSIVSRYRWTQYSGSSQTAAAVAFIPHILPDHNSTLPVVSELQRLIEE